MSVQDRVYRALEAARWAPSAHNAQPWAVAWDGDDLVVSLSRDRALIDGDPSGRQDVISVGAFVEYLVIAAAAEGLEARVVPWRPGAISAPLARLTFTEGSSNERPSRLADALHKRKTVRGEYLPALPPDLISTLTTAADCYEARADVITDEETISLIGRLVYEGNRAALALPTMKRELAALVSWGWQSEERGMSLESMFPELNASATPLSAEAFIMAMDASKAAERIGSWYATAPAIVVVSTEYDGPEAWIAGGRCAVALMLEAALAGVAHCTSAAPIEVPHLVPRLRAALSTPNRPQMLFRLGVPTSAANAPQVQRLPLEQLLSGAAPAP